VRACTPPSSATRQEAEALVADIQAIGAEAVLPPRSTRTEYRAYDRHGSTDCNRVERVFPRFTPCRRRATRYEKLARIFVPLLNLVCAYLWLA
jgi:transposase